MSTYYSETRFNNWVNRMKESNIDIEDAESIAVFDQMMEDFVVACLNVIRAVKERELTKKQAMEELDKIEKILLSEVDFNDPLKNDFFEFVRESLKVVIWSTRFYIDKKVSKKNFNALLKEAIKKEKEGDFEEAMKTVARMGAKIFSGERLPDDLEMPEDGLILNWLDGIDAINTVMILSEIDAPTDDFDGD
jgi:hypothetical protein